MTPDQHARSCIIVPTDDGDLAIFDRDGNPIIVADIRPISFGGFGMGGLLTAIEMAVNALRERNAFIRIPVKGASKPGEYWTRHPRTPTQGQSKYVAPTAVTVPARTVANAASLGLFKKPKE
jgi:hypothetical protein